MESPRNQDGIALPDQLFGAGVFSLGDKDFCEIDGEEDELVVEVAGPEFVPELGEDGLGFAVVPEPEDDPAFEPVEAKLGPAVGELAVEPTGSVQRGQRLLRLADVVQIPGEVVLGAEEKARFPAVAIRTSALRMWARPRSGWTCPIASPIWRRMRPGMWEDELLKNVSWFQDIPFHPSRPAP